MNDVKHEACANGDESTAEQEKGCSRRKFFGLAAATAVGGIALESSPVTPWGGSAHAAEVGPLIGNARLETAFRKRIEAAERMLGEGIPAQQCNGDDDLYPNRIASFTKGLPHNYLGEVDTDAYQLLLDALDSGDPNDFENIRLGGVRQLVNPQAGLAFDTEGNDPHQFAMPPAPAFASAEEAGEMVEVYWMSLLRDLHFGRYNTSLLVSQAIQELNSLSDFRGPKINGQVTVQTLFRDDLPGCLDGPYISQFLLRGTPFGAEYIERRMRTTVPGDDHGLTYFQWLAIQNGKIPTNAKFDSTRRFIRNGRDLSEWVHIDVLFQAYFNACLILGTPPDSDNKPTGGGIGCPPGPGNPYLSYTTQEAFGTWGPTFFKTLVAEVARALRAVWFQKWFVHRRLRPETFAGRVHVHRNGQASYPIHPDVLNAQVIERIKEKTGTFLLPLAFPEGSPTHPSYGAGHATVAGACVTLLKAMFDESFPLPDILVPSADGLTLQSTPTFAQLTVGGELNKLASNIATGRNHAGVHWRTDAIESLRMGEAITVAILKDHLATMNEGGHFEFTSFDGVPTVIS